MLHTGLTDRTFGVAPGRWELQRCLACGSAYLDPRPTRGSIQRAYASYYTHAPPIREPKPAGRIAYARWALRNGYANRRFGYALAPAWPVAARLVPLSPWHRAVAEVFFRHLPAPHAGARLLDVGCGNGEFLVRIAGLGWRAEGLEPDQAAVVMARAAGLDVHEGTLETLGGEERYDAITMSHTIEHLPDPLTAVRSAHRLLRPGGILWIATPNLHGLSYRRFGPHSLILDPPRHLVVFSRRGLAAVLERAGLRDLSWPRPAADALELFRRSAAIERGELSHAGEPTIGRTLAWQARAAQLRSLLRPELADELVVVGRKRRSPS